MGKTNRAPKHGWLLCHQEQQGANRETHIYASQPMPDACSALHMYFSTRHASTPYSGAALIQDLGSRLARKAVNEPHWGSFTGFQTRTEGTSGQKRQTTPPRQESRRRSWSRPRLRYRWVGATLRLGSHLGTRSRVCWALCMGVRVWNSPRKQFLRCPNRTQSSRRPGLDWEHPETTTSREPRSDRSSLGQATPLYRSITHSPNCVERMHAMNFTVSCRSFRQTRKV